MADALYDFGMIGLGVMGSNLLLNMADHGFKVIGYDKNPDKTGTLESSAKKGTIVKGVNTLAQMISQLQKPRKLMMLVPAGNPVDSVIAELIPLLEEGDIIIDGGNSHYIDTLKRITFLKEKKLHFMGIGISGGEQGARVGPSIMPGGDIEAYKQVEPILKAVAAKVNEQPCVAYLGNDAAGHYVKMVHNGIEYAIMQLISECYDVLHNGLGLTNDELHTIFADWNSGEMKSFLLEITAEIFLKKDDKSENRLVDMILDKAGAKGTGKWTSEAALDLPEPIPTIDMAVMMRNISALKEERINANNLYNPGLKKINISKEDLIQQLHDALLFATVASYAQGLSMLAKASVLLKMQIPLPEVIRVWTGGCIIRSSLLNMFGKAYEKNPQLQNLLLDEKIAGLLKSKLESLQKVVTIALLHNYPVSALSASLNYFNAYCREKLPTNLIQAQRDYFGSHTYERVDAAGIFHTDWEQDDKTVDHSSGH
ncbi:MAG: NADP-dependent phosphogluconate dehydrogenase [Chitinophagaceae bacterium]|nr:NADP-dependent phosphogluconate dehydrogenase [Chitinophagaceae bacterium]MDB5221913.1 NADP-dependent phosphogluconate dehydrogenase [Chitinophagaceae bacterium]